MTSNYQDIYSRFLRKITDYGLASLVEPDATERMYEWLRSALSHVNIRRIFATISRDDEIATLEYTMNESIDDEFDHEYVEELLSYQIIVEWTLPKVNTISLVNQMVTNSKESKFYSQQQHLEQLRALLSDSELKVARMLSDRGFMYNEYLGNTT